MILQTTLSGHFKMPLWYQEEISLCVNEMSEAEQVKAVKELHRQFTDNFGISQRK